MSSSSNLRNTNSLNNLTADQANELLANIQKSLSSLSNSNLRVVRSEVAPSGESVQLVRPMATEGGKTSEEIVGDLVNRYDYKGNNVVKATKDDLTFVEQAFGGKLTSELITSYDGSAIITDNQQDLIGEKYLAEQIRRIEDHQKNNSVIDRYAHLLYEGEKSEVPNYATSASQFYTPSYSTSSFKPVQQEYSVYSSSNYELLNQKSAGDLERERQERERQERERQERERQERERQQELLRQEQARIEQYRQQEQAYQEQLRLQQQQLTQQVHLEQSAVQDQARLEEARQQEARREEEQSRQQQLEQLRLEQFREEQLRQDQLLQEQLRQQQQLQQELALRQSRSGAFMARQSSSNHVLNNLRASASGASVRSNANNVVANGNNNSSALNASASNTYLPQHQDYSNVQHNGEMLPSELNRVTLEAYNDPHFKAMLELLMKPLNACSETIEHDAQWPSQDKLAQIAEPIIIPAPEPIVLPAPDIIRLQDTQFSAGRIPDDLMKPTVSYYPAINENDMKFYQDFALRQLNLENGSH